MLLVWALLLVAAASAETQVQLSGSRDECTLACGRNYDPSETVSACESGCRLWSIVAMSGGGGDVTGACKSSCSESFPGSGDLRGACDDGCATQKMHGTEHVEMVITSNEPINADDSSAFDALWSRVAGAKDSVFDGFTRVLGSRDPFADMDAELRKFQAAVGSAFGSAKAVGRPLYDYARGLGNVGDDGAPVVYVQLEPVRASDQFDDANTLSSLFEGAREPSPPTEREEEHREASLLRSLGGWDGVRYWALCCCLGLSILVFLWLSVLALRTAPRRRLLRARADAIAALAASKARKFSEGGAEKSFLVPNEVIQPPPPYESPTLHQCKPLIQGDEKDVV